MPRVGPLCQIRDSSVRITRSLQVLLVVMTASGMSEAMARGRSSGTMSLFGAAPIDAPQGEIRGMRPETIGEE
jgi:hypothetical protein